jgi:ribosomal protein S18 acetylase RimI-like enzyme
MNEPEAEAHAMTIRPAVREDCRAIAGLFAMSSEGLAEHIWSAIAEPGETPIDAGARRCLRRGVPFSFENCFIADHTGIAIGLLHLFAAEKAASSPMEPVDPALQPFFELRDVRSLYISALIVDPQHRGYGLGTRLLDTAEQQACVLRLPRLSLIVLEHNERAMRFYRRAGFREVDRRALATHPAVPHWTGDAILLAKPVLPPRVALWRP